MKPTVLLTTVLLSLTCFSVTVGAHELRNYLNRPSLQASTNTSSQVCKIKFFTYDQQNWKNLSYGLMQGLYTNAPQPCLQC